MFNEITKKAILEAIKHPGEIDMKMVDAQQARRVLDRLVGYQISPILWDKVRRGLSAGRVQSVALKLICDREREIEAFVPEEYWHITARLAGAEPPEFDARLVRKGDAAAKVRNQAEADVVLDALKRATFVVSSVTKKERKKHAVPPFITSKLQQASRFPVKKTMMVAQQLYEGIELPGEDAAIGLITYMRTDSVRVSDQALDEVRDHIKTQYGDSYVPEQPNRYKVKSNAQDAHEAIRPTSMKYTPESVRAQLTPDQFYLYRLIWNRFVGSQMMPALFDDTTRGHHRGRLPVPREGIGAEVRRLAGGLRAFDHGSRGERAHRDADAGAGHRRLRRRAVERRAAPACGRADARDAGNQARAEVHATAAAIQRRIARQGARRGRHRPAEHLRVDHLGAPGARVREQDRRPIPADDARDDGSSTSCCIRCSTTSSTSSTPRAWKSNSTRSKRAGRATPRR